MQEHIEARLRSDRDDYAMRFPKLKNKYWAQVDELRNKMESSLDNRAERIVQNKIKDNLVQKSFDCIIDDLASMDMMSDFAQTVLDKHEQSTSPCPIGHLIPTFTDSV